MFSCFIKLIYGYLQDGKPPPKNMLNNSSGEISARNKANKINIAAPSCLFLKITLFKGI